LALVALCHLEGVVPEDRQVALDALWSAKADVAEGAESVVATLIAEDGARRYGRRLLEQMIAGWTELDATIEATSKRWRLERMDQIDRNVLRLAAVEFRGKKTPRGVVIAEAVRLAALYGSERSPTFVNGVAESLGAVLRDADAEDSESASA
jgi:N utilization substance protein B